MRVIERVHVRGWIGHKLIAEADVHRQLGTHLPLILDISVHFDFAEVAIGVRLAGLRPLEETRSSLQESGQAGKSIEAAPPSLLLEVALDAAE